MEPIIDHIQITVKDMNIAVPFYEKFLPLLGFDIQSKASAVIEEHDFYVVEYTHPLLAFAITSPRKAFVDDTINRRKPGALHHLAFKVESRAEVDRLYFELKEIGATIVNKPKIYPEYGPDYYALFFKDLEGDLTPWIVPKSGVRLGASERGQHGQETIYGRADHQPSP